MRWEGKPYWTERLLQGLAFWVGYKSELYHYPLTEGAIVGEAAAILNGRLDREYKLKCELMYKDLDRMSGDLYGSLFNQQRADLVIENDNLIDTVIEVKRSKASNVKIKDDFKRLAKYHSSNPIARCFMLLVSQRHRPKNYINDNGNAFRKEIKGDGYRAKVRRSCKASSNFRNGNSAQYACLIEVQSDVSKT